MIAQKIQNCMYKSLDDIERDFNLMVKNAKTFNEPKSLIFKVKKLFLDHSRDLSCLYHLQQAGVRHMFYFSDIVSNGGSVNFAPTLVVALFYDSVQTNETPQTRKVVICHYYVGHTMKNKTQWHVERALIKSDYFPLVTVF